MFSLQSDMGVGFANGKSIGMPLLTPEPAQRTKSNTTLARTHRNCCSDETDAVMCVAVLHEGVQNVATHDSRSSYVKPFPSLVPLLYTSVACMHLIGNVFENSLRRHQESDCQMVVSLRDQVACYLLAWRSGQGTDVRRGFQ
eukprot:1739299-Amphidinium_carterae.1